MSTPASGADIEEFERTEPDESKTDRAIWHRQATGIILGLLLAGLVYTFFPETAVDRVYESIGADPEVEYTHHGLRVTAATTVLMATWWVTEAIPLAATSLLPIAIFPLSQVASFSEVGSPYASATIFLFMGGFLLALGLQRWNLHRRLALAVLLLVGTSPRRLILGFMIATGFLSMWVSNTATAVIMLPIGTSVLTLTAESVGGWKNQKKFSTALMLAIAYAASIGSLGTLIGTPPNALLAGYMEVNHGVVIGFGQWMLVGLPIAIVFTILAWLVLITVFKPEMKDIPGGRELIREERSKLGPWTYPQVAVGIIFVAAAVSWVFVPLILDWIGAGDFVYDDAIIGITAGLLMFILPANFQDGTRLLNWKTASELPWDVLLLFGGGLSLSAMFSASGLSLWVGEMAQGLGGLPTILLIIAVAALILFLTEFTSNTATAATFLPIMGGVAVGIGLTEGGEQNVLLLTIPVALAATCAFMLPVATPPNAIAFGSGHVKIGDMIKGGFFLNLIGLVLITIAVYFIAIPVFGIVL